MTDKKAPVLVEAEIHLELEKLSPQDGDILLVRLEKTYGYEQTEAIYRTIEHFVQEYNEETGIDVQCFVIHDGVSIELISNEQKRKILSSLLGIDLSEDGELWYAYTG